MAKEPKKMIDREIAFMKKNKAPKDMIKHEKAEKTHGGNVKAGKYHGKGLA